MKTRMAFIMAALATPVLATAADAGAQDRRCQMRGKSPRVISVRAGTPCVFGLFGLHYSEIIDPPHNGTAVLRSDGRVYYSPRPGFTGRDGMTVRLSCQALQAEGATGCGLPSPRRALAIFVE
jgi:hypothetical protein